MDGCFAIVGLFIVSLIAAAVGHGLWLVYAAIWRAIFQSGRPPSSSDVSGEQAMYRLYHSGRIDEQTLDKVLAGMRGDTRSGRVISPQRPLPMVEPIQAAEAAEAPVANGPAPVAPPPLPAHLMPHPPVWDPAASAASVSPPRVIPIPAIPEPPAPPPIPRKPWTEVLASFMKEANIRWGELVGGLLIIGCSIALVRTFWSSIADHTWLKLGVFTAITAIVFGIGLYTEHRWKLPTTSRAILIIASLLVPLTFFAVLARLTGALDPLALGGILLALGIFGFLLLVAGRVLIPEFPASLAIGVLGPSAAQMLPMLLGTATPLAMLVNASIALAFYVAANICAALVVRKQETFDESFADRLLVLLGISTFAIVPGVYQLLPADGVPAALRTLSLLFPVAAVPALTVGILLWGRLTGSAMLSRRLVGATIALLGVGVLFAAVIIAYPQPHAAIYCGIYALAAFALAYIDNRSEISWVAAGLLLVSMFLWPDLNVRQYGGSLGLIYASVCVVAAIGWGFVPGAREVFTHPLAGAALIVSMIALLHGFFRIPSEVGLAPITRWQLTIHLFWGTGIWLAASRVIRGPVVFGVFQALLSVSVVSAAWAISQVPIPSLLALRDALLGISVLTLADVVLRKAQTRLPIKLDLPSRRIDFDQFYPFVLLAGLAILAFVAVTPGVVAEFSAATEGPAISELLSIWTWLIPALLATILLLSQSDKPPLFTDVCLILAVLLSLPLAAAHMAGTSASASAWRWLSVVAMLGLSLPTWLNYPRPVKAIKPLFLLLTLLPVLALTIYPASLTFSGRSFSGPAAQTFFAHLGSAWNYVPPLLVSVAVLATHAMKDHSSKLALAAGLVLNLAISLTYALHVTTSGQAFAEHHLVRLLQFNSIATAGFAATWLLILKRRKEEVTWPMGVELAVAVIPMVVLLASGEVRLLAAPGAISEWARLIADPIGTPAAVALAFVGLWVERRVSGRISTVSVVLSMMLLGTLISLTAWSFGSWAGIHALMACRMIAAWLCLQLGWILARSLALPDIALPDTAAHGAIARLLGWQRVGHNITLPASILGAMPIAVGLLTVVDDPSHAAWTVAAILSAAALAAALSIWTLRSAVLLAMGILLNLAVSIWWQFQPLPKQLFELMYLNAVALSIGGLVSLGVELLILRPIRGDIVRRSRFTWHVLACTFATLAVAGLTLLRLVGAMPLITFGTVHPALLWMALIASSLLALLCLYDEDAWCVVPSIYVLGLLWIGQSYDLLRPFVTVQLWHAVAALGGYSVVTSLVYNLRRNIVAGLPVLGIPRRRYWPAPSPGWLTGTTYAITVIVGFLAVPYVLFDRTWGNRLAMSSAAICMAVAIGLLGAELGRKTLKTAALVAGAAGALLWSLAWVTPRQPDTLLNWLVTTMVALSVLTVLFAIASKRWLSQESEWCLSTRLLLPFLGTATVLMLPAVLGFELYEYDPNPAVPIMALPAFITVAVTLLALAAASFLCAFRPSMDPLHLSERSRTAYVYAAQILIGLVFLHARLVHPEWFGRGFFARYWPVIVILTAFANLGISELLRRRGKSLLAEPFTNIGAFLPFLLVGGFALLDSSRAIFNFSFALLLVGMMYAAMAAVRRSLVFSILALAAGNGALWNLLHTTPAYAFLEHPQLWLIPPALSALAAAYFNRDRLTREQMSTIRYVCLIVIYCSSTADVWINIDHALGLALVLAALAAAGVFVGIAARVQSFLFLGIAFSFVAVAAMIRIAAQQVHANWPWLVAGIVAGTAIVITFALFEKKRSEMLGVLEKLKDWQK